MKQNRLNKQVCPYKRQARPSKIGAIIMVGIIVVAFPTSSDRGCTPFRENGGCTSTLLGKTNYFDKKE